ncbi:MAG: phage protein, gp10 family [Proteobacteria bacterium]|nr:phage protein, gp10 family [Pseudomonadota bacterium]
MSGRITMNTRAFREQLRATAETLNAATRPAAQAGAQVIYDRARQLAPVSEKAHMFHGTHGVYGPYQPGNLREAIYQVFSKDNSFRDVSTYHVSWNAAKAPYGAMVEFGTSHSPAESFIGRAVAETRSAVRSAMKTRYLQEVAKA